MNFLPKFKQEGVNFVATGESGKWLSHSFSELDKLANSIEIKTSKDEVEINAIPDIWEQAILFETALFDTQHKLHKRILNEWKGLIALIALKDYKQLAVSFTPIFLNNIDLDKKFAQSLTENYPRNFIKRNNWNEITIIKFAERPIAMSSPSTIVFTAKNNLNRITNIPWKTDDNKFLDNPIKYLNKLEKVHLKNWLKDELYENITLVPDIANNETQNTYKTKLLAYVTAFINELDSGQNLSTTSYVASLGGQLNGIISHLITNIISGRSNQEFSSDVQLSTTKFPKSKILFIDKKLKESCFEDNDYTIFPGMNSNELPKNGLYGGEKNKIGNKQLPTNYSWLKPDDLFLENIYVFEDSTANLYKTKEKQTSHYVSIDGKKYNVILPIKKTILDYFDVYELCDCVNFKFENNQIFLKFSFPLYSSNLGKNYIFEYSKIYSKPNFEKFEFQQTPMLRLWPNININNWKYFYLFCYNDQIKLGFKVEPVYENQDTKFESSLTQIYTTEFFPEILICKDGKNSTIGYIFINSPTFDEDGYEDSSFEIGVDFGTSATQIFYKKINGNAQSINPMIFENRTLSITKCNENKSIEEQNFFTDEIKIPFYSLFCKRNNEKPQLPTRLILDGYVLFTRNVDNFFAKIKVATTNLKWSTAPTERAKLQLYLSQIFVMCFANLFTRTNNPNSTVVKFSYPLSLPDSEQFLNIAKSALNDVKTKLGFPNIVFEQIDESRASAKYFTSPKIYNVSEAANFSQGEIFIDVGGGSTDISVWQVNDKKENQLVYQTSIEYAGRNIFFDNLLKHFESVNKLLGEIFDSEKIKDDNIFNVYSYLDLELNNNWENIKKKFDLNSGTTDYQNFESDIFISLSGLFFYIGLMTKHLIKNGFLKLNDELPKIYIGGKGSRIFDWMKNTKNYEKPFNLAIQDDIKSKTLNKPLKIIFSQNPKEEVSRGLITDFNNLFTNNFDSNLELKDCFISGEEFNYKSRKDFLLNKNKLKEGVQVQNLNYFKTFILNFDSEYLTSILKDKSKDKSLDDFSSVVAKDILTSIISDYNNFVHARTDQINVEPIFIYALKKYLKDKNKKNQN